MRRQLAVLCAVLCPLLFAASAQAGPDPLFVFTPSPPPPPQPAKPPPTGYLDGPCGLAVGSGGSFYVSDYYHHTVDLYSAAANYAGAGVNGATGYLGQLTGVDPEDGPCGLAIDSSGHPYVNDYHRGVIKYEPLPSSGPGTAFPLPAEDTSHHLPTGVALDSSTRVYVDHRTYVSVYDASGAPIEEGGEPLTIGKGSLQDGYGVAVSQYPGTLGRVYVPDAGTDTVKVYNPAASKTTPVAELKDPFNHPFVSLRDSAIAVDAANGTVYFADDLQPEFTERPQAEIYAYTPANIYAGHLKYNVIDALPVGLAVDNTTSPTTQGRVYVTSGNTDKASIYAYAKGSATFGTPLPPLGSGLTAPSAGSSMASEGPVPSTGQAQSTATSPAAKASTVTQSDNLRVSVNGKLSPKRLPREGTAPISVSVGWNIASTDESPPPRLKSLEIEINRHGQFDYEGLPICPITKIQPATTQRALSNCRSALVGRGSFSAEIALKGQEGESYDTTGKLLVFNGENKGKPALFGQIYAAHPFATSFVIVFKIAKIAKGSFGTSLSATLPKTLRSWGNLNGIEMKLERRFSSSGKRRSFLSAGCPAPKGTGLASFKLARTTFAFNGGKQLSSTVTGDCRVRG